MRRDEPVKKHELQFWKLENLPDTNFRASFEKAKEPYLQSDLSMSAWELESPARKSLRAKIRKGRDTLKDEYGSPLYGIKTGYNKAFVIDNKTKNLVCEADPNSIDLLKPFLEGKDLKRWRAEPRGLWIIYIPKNRIKIKDYPAIREHLLPFKKRLKARATKQKWFELQQAQENDATKLANPKIIYNRFTDRAKFALVEEPYWINDAPYFLPYGDYFLVAYLNSNVAWWFLKSATALRGGFVQLLGRYVEPVPIPKVKKSDRKTLEYLGKSCQSAAIERYKLQQALTRRIPDLASADIQPKLTNKLKAWWEFPDFTAFRKEVKKCLKADIPLSERSEWEDWIARDKAEIARLTAEIKANEHQINTLVYELFDLTEDEISLLEANI